MKTLYDTFKESLNLISETPAQAVFECPVCAGKSLKMSRSSGAYCCFSSGCDVSSIRKHLGLKTKSFYDTSRKTSNPVFLNPDNIDFAKCFFPEQAHKHFFYKKHNQFAVRTEYHYSDSQRVDRIKLLGNNEKIFYPLSLVNNKWVIGKNGKDFQFYNQKHLSNFKDKTVIIVEGEKCSDYLSQFLYAISPVGYGSGSYSYLSNQIKSMSFSVKNFLVLADADKIGLKKANLIQQVAWENYIPCTVLSLSEGHDIYDICRDLKLNSFESITGFLLDHL